MRSTSRKVFVLAAGGLMALVAAAPTVRQQPTDSVRLLIGGPGDQRSPAWMPGGKAIVFTSSREGFPADLYLFDLESRTSRPLTTDPNGDNCPAVSPDGRWVVFHSDRARGTDLFRLDLKTSEILPLTSNPDDDGFAAWSPDSRRIAFHSAGAGNPDIWLMERDGTDKVPLVLRPGVDSTPAWSPDGRMIAFSGQTDGNPDIYLVSVEDRRLTRLTDSPEAEWAPAWSPDGRRIAYCRGPMGEGHANLWIMNADGGGQKPLTARGRWDDFHPAWAPDGRRIAFESNRAGDFDIWLLEIQASPLVVRQMLFDGSNAPPRVSLRGTERQRRDEAISLSNAGRTGLLRRHPGGSQ